MYAVVSFFSLFAFSKCCTEFYASSAFPKIVFVGFFLEFESEGVSRETVLMSSYGI